MSLKTLKSKLHTVGSNVRTLGGNGRRSGSAGIRWTGRKLREWRQRILEAEPLCRHCAQKGITTAAEEIDHMVPLAQGGTYDDDNACPLCIPCHKAKTALDMGYAPRRAIGTDGWPLA